MGIIHYLAMTGAEFQAAPVLPEKAAWMACHFSPYGLGLSNFPRNLPPGSLLIVDDITPISGHDPQIVCQQLEACVKNLECSGILLDFQRQGYPETGVLAAHLAENLSCPAAVTEAYASGTTCPVLLPLPPCHISLSAHLSSWQGREIWLETALDAETITLTEAGAEILPLSPAPESTDGFLDKDLHCHYTIQTTGDSICFTLWRSREDMNALLEEAASLGIAQAVGLYQELKTRE